MKRIPAFLWLSVYAAVLCAQSITVISPKTGDSWTQGLKYSITWNRTGNMAGSVDIRLWQSGTAIRDIARKVTNDGTYPWKIPMDLAAGSYLIRVKTIDGKVVGASRPFNITDAAPPPKAGVISISEPKVDYQWMAGQAYTVRWTESATPLSPVNIVLWQRQTKILLIGSTAGRVNHFLWNIPKNLTPGKYAIIISTLDNASSAISREFSVIQPGPFRSSNIDDGQVRTIAANQIPTLQSPPVQSFSQLSQIRINTFKPRATTVINKDFLTIDIDVDNVTDVIVIDELKGEKYSLTSYIEDRRLQHVFMRQPSGSGWWKLVASNDLSKAEDRVAIQKNIVMPEIIGITPERTTFNPNETIKVSYKVKNAETIVLIQEWGNLTMDSDIPPIALGEASGSLIANPIHTCKIHLLATNSMGKATSQTFQLVNLKESPSLAEFDAWRNRNLLGVSLSTASIKLKVRGHRLIHFYWRAANTSDIQENYYLFKSEDMATTTAAYKETQFEFTPKIFPCVVKIVTTFWDDTQTLYKKTVQ